MTDGTSSLLCLTRAAPEWWKVSRQSSSSPALLLGMLHGWHLDAALGQAGLGSFKTYEVGWVAPLMDIA